MAETSAAAGRRAARRPATLASRVHATALRALVEKELRHIARDRQTLLILLVLPLALVVVLGFAVRTDVATVRVVFVDPTPGVITAELRSRFAGSGRFEDVGTAATTAAVEPLFRRGAADLAVVLEPGFAAHLAAGRPAALQLVSDASDPNTGSTMMRYGRAVVAGYQAELRSGGRRAAPAGVDIRVRMLFNPTLESVDLFVPGLIGLVLTLVTGMMTAVALAREKERGTMEILLVSPLRPWHIIVGKVLPYLLLAFVNVVTTLLAAWAVFRVPLRGSVPLLLAASMLYAVVGLALGVLIAAVTSSQRAAMLAAIGGTMLPNVLLSGMIFPIASLPQWLQPLTMIVPSRWFNVVARGIMLQGTGLPYLWRPLAILLLMLVVLLVAAVRSFRPRLA